MGNVRGSDTVMTPRQHHRSWLRIERRLARGELRLALDLEQGLLAELELRPVCHTEGRTIRIELALDGRHECLLTRQFDVHFGIGTGKPDERMEILGGGFGGRSLHQCRVNTRGDAPLLNGGLRFLGRQNECNAKRRCADAKADQSSVHVYNPPLKMRILRFPPEKCNRPPPS